MTNKHATGIKSEHREQHCSHKRTGQMKSMGTRNDCQRNESETAAIEKGSKDWRHRSGKRVQDKTISYV